MIRERNNRTFFTTNQKPIKVGQAYVYLFGTKLFIQESEIKFFEENGFKVYK